MAGTVGVAGLAGLAATGCSPSGSKASPGTTDPNGPTSSATPTTVGAKACTLTPEMTSGPYYIDGAAVRRDVTEGKPGFPLQVEFTVIDSTTCKPLPGAAVDIWHCDANGEYSGWNGNTLAETFRNGRNKKTYLRGIQITGEDGIATFDTIYPGWYEGRAIHIHLKVHTDGTAGKTYTGGHVNHVGQVFFDDTMSDRLMKLEPYGSHTGTRTRNDEDSIYQKGGADQMLVVKPRKANDPSAGFTATVTLAIDPTAVPKPLPVA